MEEENVNKEKILTANQMIGELLFSLVIYGIIAFMIYKLISSAISSWFTENSQYVLLAFVMIALQSLMVFATFKLANKKAFKKGTIYKNDIPKVMSNIAFIIIVLLLILVVAIFSSVEPTIDILVEEDFGLQYRQRLLSYIYGDEETAKEQFEKEIKEAKNTMYKFLAILETGICVVYISAIFLEKKYLYNKAV